MVNAVNALCNTHGLSECGAALNLYLLMDGRFEPSCEFVQLFCCTHVRNLQDKRLKFVDVLLNASGLHEAADAVPCNLH